MGLGHESLESRMTFVPCAAILLRSYEAEMNDMYPGFRMSAL